MSMRYYPVYAQGAIFFAEDYDPVKVISAAADEYAGGLPSSVKDSLKSETYSQTIAKEICVLLGVPFNSRAHDYSFISDFFTECLSDWDVDGPGTINYGEVSSAYFTDLEAEYRYASENIGDESVGECLMLILPSPFVWDIAGCGGPKTKRAVIELIQEAVRPLLRDDIDWDSRLGELVGTTFG